MWFCRTYKPVMICHCMTVTKGWRPHCTTLMWQYVELENGDVKNDQAPVVQTLDSTIHRINYYLVDKAIDFPNTYWMDRFIWWVVLFNVWTTRARMLWWITPHDWGRWSDNVKIFPQPNSCYNSVFLVIYFLLIFKNLNFLTLSEKYESLPIECLSMKECAYIIN